MCFSHHASSTYSSLSQISHQRIAEARFLNQGTTKRNLSRGDGEEMTPLQKENPGHPVFVVTMPEFQTLPEYDVGTVPPWAPAGGWTKAAMRELTAIQIDHLAWFYNRVFEGVSVNDRRGTSSNFICGV